jgi:hypothetical protein
MIKKRSQIIYSYGELHLVSTNIDFSYTDSIAGTFNILKLGISTAGLLIYSIDID